MRVCACVCVGACVCVRACVCVVTLSISKLGMSKLSKENSWLRVWLDDGNSPGEEVEEVRELRVEEEEAADEVPASPGSEPLCWTLPRAMASDPSVISWLGLAGLLLLAEPELSSSPPVVNIGLLNGGDSMLM